MKTSDLFQHYNIVLPKSTVSAGATSNPNSIPFQILSRSHSPEFWTHLFPVNPDLLLHIYTSSFTPQFRCFAKIVWCAFPCVSVAFILLAIFVFLSFISSFNWYFFVVVFMLLPETPACSLLIWTNNKQLAHTFLCPLMKF